MTCRTPRRLLALLAAALVGAAAGQVAPAPAGAAGGYCASGTGVTVVVDYGSLGRGTSVGCDPRGARVTGSTVVPRAGFSLTYVARQPGFVCRVNGLPTPSRESCGNTPPQNAYWGLFWSDGRSGRWTYASVGIGSLRVPAGGFIGWRFEGATRTVPRVSPVSPRPASPKPRPRPTHKPTHKPTHTPTHKPSPTPTPKPTHHATPRPTHHATHRPTHQPAHQPAQQPAQQPTGAGQQSIHHARATPAPSGRSAATTRAPRSKARTAASPKASADGSPSTTTAPSVSGAPSSGTSATSQPSSTAAAAGSPSGSTSPAAATTDADLQSGEQTTGSPAALPVLAGGLAVVLLGSAGVVAYRRRRS